jgi:RNA polymerase sigma-70 factor (ECF subfamily)
VQAAAYGPQLLPRPPQSLEDLFARHHGAVFRAAYRITGNAMDAEDVLQTVFTRLLGRSPAPDLSASAGSYLHRAAINAALDLLRSRRRPGAVALGEVEDQLVDEANPTPDRRTGNRELARRLRLALSSLPDGQAEVFALRYLEGLGNSDIAKLLRRTQTSVAVTLHRARHRLQRELGAVEGDLS